MQQAQQMTEMGGAEHKRLGAVIETLANLRSRGESLAEVAHDAKNMVTALGLYCDLLEEPGVLPAPFAHYGGELRLVTAASRRLVERLMALDGRTAEKVSSSVAGFAPMDRQPATTKQPVPCIEQRILEAERHWEILPAEPINNLAADLAASRNLLCALAGPAITLTLNLQGGEKPVRLTAEDLTRVLVNLVKNATEAMPSGGSIEIGLSKHSAMGKAATWLALTVEDTGPGIPDEMLEGIFVSGYTTHAQAKTGNGGWPPARRGLGLAITHSIVEAAGGHIFAANRAPSGTRFVIELPVREAGS